MADVNACPEAKSLESFFLGELPEPSLDEIARHLEDCPRCLGVLQTLNPLDTLAEAANSLSRSADPAADTAVKRLIQSMREQAPERTPDQTAAFASASNTAEIEETVSSRQLPELSFLAPAQQPDEIGRLGPYRILKVLGQGGMGMVFLAHDPHLDRRVAIKVMLPRFAANADAKRRFLREARTVAKIKNDHIVSIFQVGEERDVPYFAMEFLEGEPLDRYLNEKGALPIDEILLIGRHIAQGLSAAHGQGLIHRDIKPGNLWLEASAGGPPGEFRLKILDFGLARAEKDDINLTQSGAIIGTPAYMAPEQARSDKAIDARADLFSLGVVLYRLCAGDQPFKSETTMGVLMAIAMNDPIPPAKINEHIPQALSELIMQLLEKDPAKRPASAREVTSRLQKIEAEFAELRRKMERAAELPAVAPAVPAVSSGRGKSRWPIAIAASVLGAAIVSLLGVVIYIATDNGTIEIKTEDKNIKIVAEDAGGKITILDPRTKQTWTLNTGTYTLKLGENADGFEIDLPKEKAFALKRGGVEVVTIRKVPGPTAAEKPPATTPDADRKAAEWVLSVGGRMRVIEGPGKGRNIASGQELPGPAFEVADVFLNDIASVNDASLAKLKDCKNLAHINLSKTQVSDAGLIHLKHMKALRGLALDGQTKITDAGLAHLRDIDELVELGVGHAHNVTDLGLEHIKRSWPTMSILSVGGTQVSDGGLRHVASMKSLRILNVATTKITDAGLVHLAGLGLENLVLSGTEITDAGLEHIAKLPKLTGINLPQTKVTEAGVKKLSLVLPMCRIVWDGGVIEPKVATDADRKAAKFALSLGGVVRVNGGSREFKAVAELPAGPISLTGMRLHNANIDDAGLAHFKDCRNLDVLTLLGCTKITDAGLANFKECRNLRYLHLSFSSITDSGLAHFKDCKKLLLLELGNINATDTGLANFNDCSELTALFLGDLHVTDAGLGNFSNRKNLTTLNITGCVKVSDKGLEIFKDCTKLTNLDLASTRVTNAGLANFKNCSSLNYLTLGFTQTSDEGLAHFKNCTELWQLKLYATQVTGTGLVHFKSCEKLAELYLQESKLTDTGLEICKDFKSLTVLNVRKTQVTGKAIGEFQKALPRCKIEHDGDVIEPKVAADADRKAAELLNAHANLTLAPSTGKEMIVKRGQALPPGNWVVKEIQFDGYETKRPDNFVAQTYLPAVRNLKSLERILSIAPPYGIQITGRDLGEMASMPFAAELRGCEGLQLTADLGEVLPKFPKLGWFRCDATQADDAVLKRLGTFKNLHTLNTKNLGASGKVTAEGFRALTGLPLTALTLHGARGIDAKVCAEIAKMPTLVTLYLQESDVGDEGLAALKPLKKLVNLSLAQTLVTDAGLENLTDLPALKNLRLSGSKVTTAGVYKLAIRLPLCRITWDSGVAVGAASPLTTKQREAMYNLMKKGGGFRLAIQAGGTDWIARNAKIPEGPLAVDLVWVGGPGVPTWFADDTADAFAELPAVHMADLSGSKIGDAGLGKIVAYPGMQKLSVLHLQITQVTDAGLKHLAKLKSMTRVNLGNCKVTAAGIQGLAAALPNCRIEWDGGVIGAKKK